MIPWEQRKHQRVHHCPSCNAILSDVPKGESLSCASCPWYLVLLSEWRQMRPFDQGHAMYRQAAWPTSELAGVKNPYAEGTASWKKFNDGAAHAAQSAQDSEA